MGKHAYLIMAHDNFDILKRLCSCLDHERNDLYIHIDARVKDFKEDSIRVIMKKSSVYFTRRICVTWGGYSQIKCEILLLEEALSQYNYDYLHFMSGVDFPIKPITEILDFFDNNSGMEFVDIVKEKNFYLQSKTRYSIFHFFQDYIGKTRNFLYYINFGIRKAQELMGIDRTKRCQITFYGGSNWCSITAKAGDYILSQVENYKKYFLYTFCCDEFFIQTILGNSSFKKNIYMLEEDALPRFGCKRYIDWERGMPYVFQIDDYERLISSNYLFARKIGAKNLKEEQLLDKLEKYIKSHN